VSGTSNGPDLSECSSFIFPPDICPTVERARRMFFFFFFLFSHCGF